MIHYTLLPEKEIRTLKREYRTRLVIFLTFFISFSILVGIFALLPAYIYSYFEEKESLNSILDLKDSGKENGKEDVLKELNENAKLIDRLEGHKSTIVFSDLISKVIKHKPAGLYINSFDMFKTSENATSTIMLVMQGKSSTRESLILFKDRLEADPLISSVELPISDLAKSRDISYSIKVNIIPIK